ncbi:hypothetical protein [Geobacter sp. DSM 9736]|uniref:hypothetical protein n=1 Tax=Geobacter sp. DSM 9736 TaxID=1277350 RepID=UPI0012FD25C9|nr:hypothetical protein [Geobacter sp. DSM 9736]
MEAAVQTRGLAAAWGEGQVDPPTGAAPIVAVVPELVAAVVLWVAIQAAPRVEERVVPWVAVLQAVLWVAVLQAAAQATDKLKWVSPASREHPCYYISLLPFRHW